LAGEAHADYTNAMAWNDYNEWSGDVDHYKMFKLIGGILQGSSINLNPGFNFFRDEISSKIHTEGEFCYYVEAYEGVGNDFGFMDTSRSNEICILQQPAVFIPNAFLPGGPPLNNVFNPSASFVDVDTYSLDIFNRWGERVFHSSNPSLGWDGITNGKDAPASVYIYLLKVTGVDGTQIERKGSVTLLR
jgi:gliding motility-associated-like protein